MPDRIIRDRARQSPTLQILSDAGERGWWRLTVAVDDYGRFEADPGLLLTDLFKRRPAGWTATKMAHAVDEWEAAGLIHRYQIPGDDRVYGHVLTFKTWQRERSSRPKYPDPPCKGKSYPPESTPCRQSLHQAPTSRQSRNAASRGRSRQVAAYSDSERRETRDERRRARESGKLPQNPPSPADQVEPGSLSRPGPDGLGYDPTDPVALKARVEELRRVKGYRGEPTAVGDILRAPAEHAP